MNECKLNLKKSIVNLVKKIENCESNLSKS